MRKLFLVLIFHFVLFANAQEFSKKEFNTIYLETGKIREWIMESETDKLGTKLKISDYPNFKDFERIFTVQQVNFNNTKTHTYAQPYFYLTSAENIIELTIPAMKILEKRDGEKYERGKYYFVLKANLEYDWNTQKVYFKNSRLLTEENEIENWWLGQWKNYMPEVVKVSDKFGFKPPPPPCPPENLK